MSADDFQSAGDSVDLSYESAPSSFGGYTNREWNALSDEEQRDLSNRASEQFIRLAVVQSGKTDMAWIYVYEVMEELFLDPHFQIEVAKYQKLKGAEQYLITKTSEPLPEELLKSISEQAKLVQDIFTREVERQVAVHLFYTDFMNTSTKAQLDSLNRLVEKRKKEIVNTKRNHPEKESDKYASFVSILIESEMTREAWEQETRLNIVSELALTELSNSAKSSYSITDVRRRYDSFVAAELKKNPYNVQFKLEFVNEDDRVAAEMKEAARKEEDRKLFAEFDDIPEGVEENQADKEELKAFLGINDVRPELKKQLSRLKVGETSGVFELSGTEYTVTLLAKKDPELVSYEDMYNGIVSEMHLAAKREAYQKEIERLKKRYHFNINPLAYVFFTEDLDSQDVEEAGAEK